jgi:hypothetical protein
MASYLKGEDITLSFYTLAPGGCLILGINFVDAYFKSFTIKKWCTRGRSWLRHCATSRKVAGSIPDGVIGILHWPNNSGRNMNLLLTQPLTEWVTGIFPRRVKAADAWGWQPYHLHMSIVMKCGNLTLLENSGPLQASTGIALPCFTLLLRSCPTAEPPVCERERLWSCAKRWRIKHTFRFFWNCA